MNDTPTPDYNVNRHQQLRSKKGRLTEDESSELQRQERALEQLARLLGLSVQQAELRCLTRATDSFRSALGCKVGGQDVDLPGRGETWQCDCGVWNPGDKLACAQCFKLKPEVDAEPEH